jgi:hypothetical protein
MNEINQLKNKLEVLNVDNAIKAHQIELLEKELAKQKEIKEVYIELVNSQANLIKKLEAQISLIVLRSEELVSRITKI